MRSCTGGWSEKGVLVELRSQAQYGKLPSDSAVWESGIQHLSIQTKVCTHYMYDHDE